MPQIISSEHFDKMIAMGKKFSPVGDSVLTVAYTTIEHAYEVAKNNVDGIIIQVGIDTHQKIDLDNDGLFVIHIKHENLNTSQTGNGYTGILQAWIED